MMQISLLLMKSLNKTETPIFYLQCVLCFQGQSFLLLFDKNVKLHRKSYADRIDY